MRILVVKRSSLAVTAAAGLLALAGCAAGPGSSVQGTWGPEGRPAQPYGKVLVVGLSPDARVRCRFERALAAKINSGSTTAVSSCEVVDPAAPLDRALIEQAVAANGFDAVLTTKLISKNWAPQGGGSRDTRGSAGYKATDGGIADVSGYYGGVYSVPVVYGQYHVNAESIVIVGQAQVESKLWAVAGPTMIQSLETNVKGVESSDAGLALVTRAIAERLRKDGVVR
jgi:hypothetical protein